MRFRFPIDIIDTMFSGTLKGWVYVIATVVISYFCLRFGIQLYKAWRNEIKKK